MIKPLNQTPKYWLTVDDCEILFKHFSQKITFDEPLPPFNTRFPGKLESILGSVRQTYAAKHLNPTIVDAASAYFFQLITGHPFQNGNKRLAILFVHIFLLSHQLNLNVPTQTVKSIIKESFSKYITAK